MAALQSDSYIAVPYSITHLSGIMVLSGVVPCFCIVVLFCFCFFSRDCRTKCPEHVEKCLAHTVDRNFCSFDKGSSLTYSVGGKREWLPCTNIWETLRVPYLYLKDVNQKSGSNIQPILRVHTGMATTANLYI